MPFSRPSGAPLSLTEDHILSVLFVRQARSAVFGENLFSDPAWDILLELYAANLAGRGLSLSDLCAAIEAPSSTTERWIAVLGDRELIHSVIDQRHPAGIVLGLTEEATTKMAKLVSRWAAAFALI